jgi:hypothetical protein
MKCEACTVNNCEVCTGVVFGERELPCKCPDAMHDSPRKFREFDEAIPEVHTILIVDGKPVIDPEEDIRQSADFWKATAIDMKLRFDRIKAANEGNKDSRRKLKKRLEDD